MRGTINTRPSNKWPSKKWPSNKRPSPARVAVSAALAAMLPVCAVAQVPAERGLSLTATVSAQRDTNVLRLQDGETPADAGIASSSRADLIVSPVIQLDMLADPGRQRLYATVVARDTRFDRLGQFDTRVNDYRAGWVWQLAHGFSGDLSSSRDEQNTSFEDFVGTRRNVLTTRRHHADASWRPRPDRRLTFTADALDGRNSEATRRGSDYSIRIQRLEAAAVSARAQEFALALHTTDGEYPTPAFFGFTAVSNNYRQHNADLILRLRGDRRLRGELRAGYTWRRYDEVPERDVEGPGGQAALTWDATGKVQLDASAGRDFSATDDFDNLYTVSDRQRLAVRYLMRAQLAFSAEFRRRRVDFRGDPEGFTLPGAQREKRVDRYSERRFGITWLPSADWIVDLSYAPQSRTSNFPGLQFRSELVQCVLQYRWRP